MFSLLISHAAAPTIASSAIRRGHGDFGFGGVSLTAPRNSPAAVTALVTRRRRVILLIEVVWISGSNGPGSAYAVRDRFLVFGAERSSSWSSRSAPGVPSRSCWERSRSALISAPRRIATFVIHIHTRKQMTPPSV